MKYLLPFSVAYYTSLSRNTLPMTSTYDLFTIELYYTLKAVMYLYAMIMFRNNSILYILCLKLYWCNLFYVPFIFYFTGFLIAAIFIQILHFTCTVKTCTVHFIMWLPVIFNRLWFNWIKLSWIKFCLTVKPVGKFWRTILSSTT